MSMRPLSDRTAAACRGGGTLDVEEPDILRVLLDELAAGLDVLAHERREDGVGGDGVIDRHLTQRAGRGVHGRLPQLFVVHLAETLVALDPVLLRDALAA